MILLDLDPQFRVAEAHPIADCRPEHLGISAPVNTAHKGPEICP
jgi:hypothetical protein